jgi:hypothetical protein
MSQEITSPATTFVEPPWKQSAKGAVYCMWRNLPEDISSQLKQEDRYGINLGEFHYDVKQNQDGGFIVFRKTKVQYEANKNRQQYFKKSIYRTVEIQALPIEQANKLLSAAEDYDLVGTDPVKVINGELLVVIGKKERKKESETK